MPGFAPKLLAGSKIHHMAHCSLWVEVFRVRTRAVVLDLVVDHVLDPQLAHLVIQRFWTGSGGVGRRRRYGVVVLIILVV